MATYPNNPAAWWLTMGATEKLASLRAVGTIGTDPEDFANGDFDAAVTAYAARMIRADEVGELIDDLYYAAEPLRRIAAGKPSQPGDAAMLRILAKKAGHVFDTIEKEIGA